MNETLETMAMQVVFFAVLLGAVKILSTLH